MTFVNQRQSRFARDYPILSKSTVKKGNSIRAVDYTTIFMHARIDIKLCPSALFQLNF